MKKLNPRVLFAIFLVSLSVLFYFVQVTVFHSERDTSFYFLQDMAFLPLQVVIVTIVIGRLQNEREKRDRLKKMNMAISAFFSEAGTNFLTQLLSMTQNPEIICVNMSIQLAWGNAEFTKALQSVPFAAIRSIWKR
jgi:hypothetical protein